MHVEGIIIQKTPYKERDIICHVLLRSGKTIPVYFYGGRGGGKKSKGSIIEIGFMLKLQLQEQRKKLETGIFIAKEYSLLWASDKIRNNYQALCLLSFFLEFTSKIALKDDPVEGHGDDSEGLFRVVSNAIFYLDHSLVNEKFDLSTQLFIFFAKLIIELGITPNIENCRYCEKKLTESEFCLFSPVEGGFSCHDCNSKQDEFLSDNANLKSEYMSSVKLRKGLSYVFNMHYKDYESLEQMTHGLTAAQFNYINYQFEFNVSGFKTWPLLLV